MINKTRSLLTSILTVLLVMSLLPVQAFAQSFEPGTYAGEAEAHNGPLHVEVELSENQIESVTITEETETEGIADEALEAIPQAIVDQQSLEIDVISGSTVTGDAIIEAVKAALLAAGANDFIAQDSQDEDSDDEDQELIEQTADVIIIGSGGAGMSAAVEVLNADGSVIIIDKMGSTGGNTIFAGSAMNAADPEEQKKQEMPHSSVEAIEELLELEPEDDQMAAWQEEVRQDIEEYKENDETYLYDSPALHKLQTYVGGDYVANPELIEVFGDGALDSVEWLKGLGAKFHEHITAAIGATWTRSHNPTDDFGNLGTSFILPQQQEVEDQGGEILLEYTAEELIQEDGRITGVRGTTGDGVPFELYGDKGVILATGGFSANPEMREKYNKHWSKVDESIPTTNMIGATGDGIVMAEEVGAALVGMEWLQMLPRSSASLTASIENTISVNQSGQRFIREDARRDELSQALLDQEGGYSYTIYDKHTIIDDLGGVNIRGDEIASDPDKGGYYAETLEELAEMIDVPYEELQETIDQFNRYVAGEEEDPLGRKLFNQPLDEGPYYAAKAQPQFHHTMGGVEINTDTQVLDTEGEVIPGLYAAGEVTGGIHGANRLGGNAISDIITFGRIAGQKVMEQ